jgi:signal peptidase II
MLNNLKMTNRNLHWLLWPGLLTVAFDQGLKIMTAMSLRPNQTLPILDQTWLRWTRLPNSGIIFQSFEMVYTPENALWTRFLPVLALLLTALTLGWAASRMDGTKTSRLLATGFSIFWFGGLSNVMSHFRSIFVDDTVSAQFLPGGRFFNFNIADLGITIGMALVLVEIFRQVKPKAV